MICVLKRRVHQKPGYYEQLHQLRVCYLRLTRAQFGCLIFARFWSPILGQGPFARGLFGTFDLDRPRTVCILSFF